MNKISKQVHRTGAIELGVCLAAYGSIELRTALEQVARFGPLYLDIPTDTVLGLVDAQRCLTDGDYLDSVTRVLSDTAASAGQRVGCVSNSRDLQLLLGPHGPHTDPVIRGTVLEKRTHALRCGLGAIRLAERIGASTVRLLVGCPDYARWFSWWESDVSWQDNVDEFLSVAHPLLCAARDRGVKLLLEPHPKQIVYDHASAQQVLTAASPWKETLALCIDPANMAAIGHDPVQSVVGWGNRMAAVHAKDLQRWARRGSPKGHGWSRYGPQPAIRFRAVGLGELDWPAIVSALLDEGFCGILYAEHEDTLLPRDQSISQTLQVLRSLVPCGNPEGRTW